MPPPNHPTSSADLEPFESVQAKVMAELEKAAASYRSVIAGVGVTLDAWNNERLSAQRRNKDSAT